MIGWRAVVVRVITALTCVLRIVGCVVAKYWNIGWTLQRKLGREEFGEEMEKEDRRVRKETRENGLS